MSIFPEFRERIKDIGAQAFGDEAEAVRALLPEVNGFREKQDAIYQRAQRYVVAVRTQGKRSGIEQFQHEYGLNNREGIMIMCLAEALLRIPDAATADRLIHDKLADGQWDLHTGFGRPWLTRMGALGLELAGKVSDPHLFAFSAGEFVGRLVHRLGEPIVRSALKAAMKMMGGAFVIGANLQTATLHAKQYRDGHSVFSFDMLGRARAPPRRRRLILRVISTRLRRRKPATASRSSSPPCIRNLNCAIWKRLSGNCFPCCAGSSRRRRKKGRL